MAAILLHWLVFPEETIDYNIKLAHHVEALSLIKKVYSGESAEVH